MGEDWVNIKLTKFGEQFAAGGPVRVHEGNGPEFAVKAGETLRVTRAFDWERVLKQQHVNGLALFEIAPEEDAKPKKAQPRAAAVPKNGNGEEK